MLAATALPTGTSTTKRYGHVYTLLFDDGVTKYDVSAADIRESTMISASDSRAVDAGTMAGTVTPKCPLTAWELNLMVVAELLEHAGWEGHLYEVELRKLGVLPHLPLLPAAAFQAQGSDTEGTRDAIGDWQFITAGPTEGIRAFWQQGRQKSGGQRCWQRPASVEEAATAEAQADRAAAAAKHDTQQREDSEAALAAAASGGGMSSVPAREAIRAMQRSKQRELEARKALAAASAVGNAPCSAAFHALTSPYRPPFARACASVLDFVNGTLCAPRGAPGGVAEDRRWAKLFVASQAAIDARRAELTINAAASDAPPQSAVAGAGVVELGRADADVADAVDVIAAEAAREHALAALSATAAVDEHESEQLLEGTAATALLIADFGQGAAPHTYSVDVKSVC